MINIAICDDERIVTGQVEEMILKACEQESIQVNTDIYYSGKSLDEAMKQGASYDLIYLDIQMKQGDGITAAANIRKRNEDVLFIYVSGYDEYMMELFQLDVFAFIKKPIDTGRFTRIFLDAVRKISSQMYYFPFEYKKAQYKVLCMDILYFESNGRKIHIYTRNQDKQTFYDKLSDVESYLEQGKVPFLRIHQSYLVNYHHIKSRTKTEVTLTDGKKLSALLRYFLILVLGRLITLIIPWTPGHPNLYVITEIFFPCFFIYLGKRKRNFRIALRYFIFYHLLPELAVYPLVLLLPSPSQLYTGYCLSGLLRSNITYCVYAYHKEKGIHKFFYAYSIVCTLVFSCIMLHFGVTLANMPISNSYCYISMGLLVIQIVCYELYVQIRARYMQEKQQLVHALKLEQSQDSVIQQNQFLRDFYKERHDLLNELIVLKSGIENNDKEAALKELDKIVGSCRKLKSFAHSGNRTVDAVLNYKYALARQHGIRFELNVFLPPVLPIDPYDLGIIIGNALDNAIEAAKECPEKCIRISMGIKRSSLIMVIKNPFDCELRQGSGDRLLSTKPQPWRHGYGLASIMQTADKYDGETIIDTADGTFVLTILLNLQASPAAPGDKQIPENI